MDKISYGKYLASPQYRKFPFKGFIGWLIAKSNTPAQPQLPESGVDPTTREITDTWEQIQVAINEGVHSTRYQLGDTKSYAMDSYGEVVMQIVAFDVDDKADGTGKAAISWVSRDVVTTRSINDEYIDKTWEDTDMRSWLRGEFYNAMPDEVKNVIVEVQKTYFYSYRTKTCNDSVWLPSAREIDEGSELESSGTVYTTFFNGYEARIKKYNGTPTDWWLRSAYIDGLTYFKVTSNGDCRTWDVDYAEGVVIGFCM